MVIALQFPSHLSYLIQNARLAGSETSGGALAEINVLILLLQHSNSTVQLEPQKTTMEQTTDSLHLHCSTCRGRATRTDVQMCAQTRTHVD